MNKRKSSKNKQTMFGEPGSFGAIRFLLMLPPERLEVASESSNG